MQCIEATTDSAPKRSNLHKAQPGGLTNTEFEGHDYDDEFRKLSICGQHTVL